MNECLADLVNGAAVTQVKQADNIPAAQAAQAGYDLASQIGQQPDLDLEKEAAVQNLIETFRQGR